MSLCDAEFVPVTFGSIEQDDGFRAFHDWAVPANMATLASTDAFARGLEEGQQLAVAAFETDRVALVALLNSAKAIQPPESEAVNRLILENVERLVVEIVGEAPIDRQWLAEQASHITAAAGSLDEKKILWLNPDDIALLDGIKCSAKLQPDSTMDRGSLRLELEDGCLEHGRAVMLDALRSRISDEGHAS